MSPLKVPEPTVDPITAGVKSGAHGAIATFENVPAATVPSAWLDTANPACENAPPHTDAGNV